MSGDAHAVNKGVDGVARPSRLGSKCFVAHANPVTGKTEWVMQAEDYDYHQEIARSAYADMLHDIERNQKYYAAIAKAVQQLRERGREVRVLDIGTGTGLLSMMAATAGADVVTACEAFQPMAECAEQVMAANGFTDEIQLIRKRSTDVTVGPDGDMKCRANLLVTEVFDTELIGEGAISTYTHAHQHLLEEDCLVVPRAANVYIQPVKSQFIRRWNDPQPVEVNPGDHIVFPPEYTNCGGAPSLHDLQLDQVDEHLFTPISQPVKVFRFDFSKRGALKKWDSFEATIRPLQDGVVDAVFMWWDLEMDPEGEVYLSCAPSWEHPDGKDLPWRDHWMQAIFYPARPFPVKQEEKFRIISQHDEYSMWFEASPFGQAPKVLERPVCQCGLHITLSRPRLAILSDPVRNSIYLKLLKKHINSSSVCMCISDGSLLSLMAAKLGAKKVFAVEGNVMCARIIENIIKANRLEGKITLIEKAACDIKTEDLQGFKVDLVVGEPMFQAHVLPWDNMHFWYAISSLQPLLHPDAQILPFAMTVRAVVMHFSDLWKIRAPVGLCEGFLLNIFDSMIKASSDVVDESVEPQPLWEYPGIALSKPAEVFTLDFRKPDTLTAKQEKQLRLECLEDGSANGVAMWCEFDFGDGLVINTGPREPPAVGTKVEWDFYTRQGVHLFHQPHTVDCGDTIDFNVKFTPEDGSVCFTWL
ncbi:hypothetical protein BaRGS_00004042 [Batillaria attramentaria]|uniref:Protein arginine N-methyltransferase n=1 Tax=Batillaria attramentaria TaxID=370345 RepID=A0ABD0LZG8_9CAEN